MNHKLRRALILLIIGLISISIVVFSVLMLYGTAFREARERLAEFARSHARLLESEIRFRMEHSPELNPEHLDTEAVETFIDAHKHYAGFGKSGQFALAKRNGDMIEYLLSHRNNEFRNPNPVPFDSLYIEPIRRALTGQSGVMVHRDYHGQTLLAAYEPVGVADLGLVAQIKLSEVRAPYIRTGIAAVSFAVVLIIFGLFLLYRISDPVVRSLNDRTLKLKEINRILLEQMESRRQQEAEIRLLLHSTHEGFSIMDTRGNFLDVNDAYLNLTGYTREEMLNLNLRDIEVDDASEDTGEHLDNVLQEGGDFYEAQYRSRDGNLLDLELNTTYMDIEDGRILTFYREITERKRHEEEVLIARKRAEAASRAKSEFLASISHELRTPLNAIIGFSDMLNEKIYGDLNGKQEQYVKDIQESGRHLLSLINDILDLSKIEAGRMELNLKNFLLRNLLKNSLIMVKERCLIRNIRLQLGISEDMKDLMIRADERKLKQVLYNLLSNAVKFSPDGGAIRLYADVQDHEAVISVTDSGIGIAPEEQEKIFDEFYQVKGGTQDKTPGTGLGLNLVKNMIELHGGKVWVESKGEGTGSCFIFTLPL